MFTSRPQLSPFVVDMTNPSAPGSMPLHVSELGRRPWTTTARQPTQPTGHNATASRAIAPDHAKGLAVTEAVFPTPSQPDASTATPEDPPPSRPTTTGPAPTNPPPHRPGPPRLSAGARARHGPDGEAHPLDRRRRPATIRGTSQTKLNGAAGRAALPAGPLVAEPPHARPWSSQPPHAMPPTPPRRHRPPATAQPPGPQPPGRPAQLVTERPPPRRPPPPSRPAGHRAAGHRTTSHRTTSHRTTSHRTTSHRTTSHRTTGPVPTDPCRRTRPGPAAMDHPGPPRALHPRPDPRDLGQSMPRETVGSSTGPRPTAGAERSRSWPGRWLAPGVRSSPRGAARLPARPVPGLGQPHRAGDVLRPCARSGCRQPHGITPPTASGPTLRRRGRGPRLARRASTRGRQRASVQSRDGRRATTPASTPPGRDGPADRRSPRRAKPRPGPASRLSNDRERGLDTSRPRDTELSTSRRLYRQRSKTGE